MARCCKRGNVFRLTFALGVSLSAFTNGALMSAGVSSEDTDTNIVVLDSKRLFALGMVESGNDDWGVGKAGEVSRYQIHPAVWKAYSESKRYYDPAVAHQVAGQHWNQLTRYFREKAGRQPTDFDMYVLWNTKFGYYARKQFDPALLPETLRDRAQRFVNLVNR
jgi:hypothetical protein